MGPPRSRLAALILGVVITALVATLIVQDRRIARLEAQAAASLPSAPPLVASPFVTPASAPEVAARRPDLPPLPAEGPSPFDPPARTAELGGEARGGPPPLLAPSRSLPSPSRPLPSEQPAAAARGVVPGKLDVEDAAPPPPQMPAPSDKPQL